jgi:predicted RNA-binding protein with RPS1 domain
MSGRRRLNHKFSRSSCKPKYIGTSSMGGFAAKQRRRLERQSLQPSTEQNIVEKSRTEDVSLREHPRKQKNTTTERRAPKKKVQKPKHLKRKLEALKNGGKCLGEEEEEHLRRQMKEFELIKRRRLELPFAEEPPYLSSESNQSSSGKQRQNPQKSSSGEIEIEPFLGSKDAESRICESNIKIGDEDSDEEVELNLNSSRQRGKRRRGRHDISGSAVSTSDVKTVAEEKEDSIVTTKSTEMKFGFDSSEGVVVSSRDSSSSVTKSPVEIQTKDSCNLRRCIGRKPVTDFNVGQCYSGKVVYAKLFGVFFDIGCHSDAFCHVSQLSDRFIESPIEAFPVGQTIENSIRVVAVDRRKKRLTVSLQPPSSIKNSERFQKSNEPPSASRDEVLLDEDSRSRTVISAESGNVSSHVTGPPESKVPSAVQAELRKESVEVNSVKELTFEDQQKRARKIARRAERRAAGVR